MEQLNFLDVLGQPGSRPARTPSPKQEQIKEQPAPRSVPALGTLNPAHLARLDYTWQCPLIGEVYHCQDCSLFQRAVIGEDDKGRYLTIKCKAKQYIDPDTGKLGAEYCLLLKSTDSRALWIKDVLYPGRPAETLRGAIPVDPLKEREVKYNVNR